MWWIYAILSAVFASLTAMFAKVGVSGINSNLATAIRTIVVLLLLWGIVIAKGEFKGFSLISKHSLLFLVLSGLATGFSWMFYFKALQLGPVSQVATIDKLSVAITIILAAIFFHEPISLKTALAASLIISGTVLLIA